MLKTKCLGILNIDEVILLDESIYRTKVPDDAKGNLLNTKWYSMTLAENIHWGHNSWRDSKPNVSR